MEPASGRELRRESQATRLHDGDEIVENRVREAFVENALVSVRLKIELQTLEFDAKLVGDELERQRPVVGLTRLRAERRELGADVRDNVIPLRARVVEEFENIGRRFLNDVRHGCSFCVSGSTAGRKSARSRPYLIPSLGLP